MSIRRSNSRSMLVRTRQPLQGSDIGRFAVNCLAEACNEVHGHRSSIRARRATGLTLIFCRGTQAR